jgi:hypothetical protein
MKKQSRGQAGVQQVSKSLTGASKTLRSDVEAAGENLRGAVEGGTKAVKEHPKAAIGAALGATFAAGVVAGAQVAKMRKGRKSR